MSKIGREPSKAGRVTADLLHFCVFYQLKQSEVSVITKKLVWIQVACWVGFYVFLLFYTIQKWENVTYSIWAATIAVVAYLVAVYGNANWLVPRYFRTNKPRYFLFAVLLLSVLQLVRMYAQVAVLLPLHPKFYSWAIPHFSFVFITNLLAFVFGGLLRVTVNYLNLLRKQEEMKTQQLASELQLLKAQVQPHFLFNTLNNIYYLAYTKNDRTAEVVARLSDIMRYFVEDAPKERLPLQTEISFLKNYIELEQIRMLHQAKVQFKQGTIDESLMIPPMLLIPLVENIYKHGIDKANVVNNVAIALEQQDGYLFFSTCNTCYGTESNGNGGVGLTNLRKRLTILYGNNFELQSSKTKESFEVMLKFPVT